MLWLFLFILILIFVLSVSEYRAHDCIQGKTCIYNAEIPNKSDKNEEYIDKLRKMVQNNYDFVCWRQALLVALVVLIPIIYFVYQRLPDFYEFFIITSIVFLGTYLSSVWIWNYFYYPNGHNIEKALLKLRDKITDKKKKKKKYKYDFDFSDFSLTKETDSFSFV